MDSDKILLLEDRIREALMGDDYTLPITQAYFRLSEAYKLSRIWSIKARNVFCQEQIQFIKVLLRIMDHNREVITPEQHFHNLIFFSSFISDPHIKRYTKYAVKNISFKCIPIAYLDESRLSESDAFLLRNKKEFFIPFILTDLSNIELVEVILEFINNTPYKVDSSWYKLYRRRLLLYKSIKNQLR